MDDAHAYKMRTGKDRFYVLLFYLASQRRDFGNIFGNSEAFSDENYVDDVNKFFRDFYRN